MSFHTPSLSMDDALRQVLSIAAQTDADGLSAQERANVAVSYAIETAKAPWPLAM